MEINGFIDVTGLTYCGKEGQEIFAQDVYNIDLRSYGITMMDGVKGKQKIYSGELGEVWQEYSCPFTPNGDVKLAEHFIEPVAIKVNMEECYDVFWPTYLVEQTSITLNGGVPRSFGEWFFGKLRDKMAKEYQEIFWQGDTDHSGDTKAYLEVTDGIEKLVAADGENISGAAITVDNVVAQVEAVIMKGIEVAGETSTDNYKVFMNKQDVKVLEVALGKLCCGNSNSQIFGNYAKANGNIYVMGYEVVPAEVSKNVIIFGPAKNLVLGFDTYDSHIQYKFIDLRDTTGDNAFRILAISNIAVGVIFPELFVISKP